MSVSPSLMVYVSAPEGQCSIMAIASARTCVSSVWVAISAMVVIWLAQNPEFVHRIQSNRVTIFLLPGYVSWRSSFVLVGAISGLSKLILRCVLLQNRL